MHEEATMEMFVNTPVREVCWTWQYGWARCVYALVVNDGTHKIPRVVQAIVKKICEWEGHLFDSPTATLLLRLTIGKKVIDTVCPCYICPSTSLYARRCIHRFQ